MICIPSRNSHALKISLIYDLICYIAVYLGLSSLKTGQVGLGVGSCPRNRTTRDRLPSELDYTS